jgi:beta-galactosidase
LLVTAFSDVVDGNDRFRSGGFGTQVRDLLGVVVEDFGALVAPGSAGPGQQHAQVAGDGFGFAGSFLAEEAHVVDAVVLASFDGGRQHGGPALTSRRHGAGTAYYLATVPDDDGARQVLEHLFAAAKVRPVLEGLPPMVEAIRRGPLLTVINHGAEPVRVAVQGRDVLAESVVREVTLEPFGYALVRPDR